jgi:rare lipoprotein A (peptidoglycan hydrolase)
MKVLSVIFFVCFFFTADAQTGVTKMPAKDSNILVADNILTPPAIAKPDTKNSFDSITTKSSKTLLGIASFYSQNLEGTETSTGETFSHQNLTAASNNFKLNSWVRVTNLRNGRSVIVRINDRMHPAMAAKGRIVDLSISAAKKIGLTFLAGLTKVKVEEVVKGTIQ